MTLESIFARGICGSLALKNNHIDCKAGYDAVANQNVYMNCVMKLDKIALALFHPADGVYHISLEAKDDIKILKEISNEKKVDEFFKEFLTEISSDELEDFRELYENLAFKKALCENPLFTNMLSERSHKVAVLILEGIELVEADKANLNIANGFYFIERKHVSSKQIKFILLSEKYENSVENKKIEQQHPEVEFHYIKTNVIKEIPYSYKTEGPAILTAKLFVEIAAPHFLPKMQDIFANHYANQNKPMFIHVTRL